MAQYVYTMNRVGKIVPPKRQILRDISLSFFPGAKIGVLGLNGSGKSTLLQLMAGLPQDPQLNPEHTVRQSVEEGLGAVVSAKKRLDEVYAAYAEPDADFDALAAEQAELEAIIAAAASSGSDDIEHQMEIAADALRLPKCGGALQVQPTANTTVEVSCPDAGGWRLFVPVKKPLPPPISPLPSVMQPG
ncbi:hypothetical protein G6F22_015781 [Rhizopus arrhizus]|nr:hypothetical protein G6F22_015781 [Rhizopus arrhizus]